MREQGVSKDAKFPVYSQEIDCLDKEFFILQG